MSLLSFPNEVLFHIADFLEYSWNISALSQTNRFLYSLLNPYVYRLNVRHFDSSLFAWAMENGSEMIAQKMLEAGASPTKGCVQNHYQLIDSAATRGQTGIVRLFLEGGLIPVDRYGDLLMKAAIFGRDSVVQLLREHGACITSKMAKDLLLSSQACGFDVTTLLLDKLWNDASRDEAMAILSWELNRRAEIGCLETVQYLLRFGVSPNPTRPGDLGPVASAAGRGQLDIVRCLLDFGVDPNQALGRSYDNPIYRAIAWNHMEVASLLFERLGLGEHNPATESERGLILCMAAACGLEHHVRRLLNDDPLSEEDLFGVPFDRPGYRGPLVLAARAGNEAIVALLLDQAQYLNGGSISLQEPLHVAVREGHERILRLLLDHGAEPNFRDSSLVSPLSLAIEHKTIFQLLLERGADPMLPVFYRNDRVGLMSAVIQSGKTALVELLLNRDVLVENQFQANDNDCLRWAMKGGPAMLQYLCMRGVLKFPSTQSERQAAVMSAICDGLTGSLDFLLSAGFDMPQGFHHLLDYFYEPCPTETLDVLLKHGMDINKKDRWGYTALLHTVQEPIPQHVRYFLGKGADPLIPDNDGNTPLFHAVQSLEAPEIRLMLQSIRIPSVPYTDLQREIARCLAVADGRKDWDKVKMLERFQVDLCYTVRT